MHKFVIVSVFLILNLKLICGRASNSLRDCQAIAAKFLTTVTNGSVPDITATNGLNVSCYGLNQTMCPGNFSNSNGMCIFQHKLAVTCSQSSTTVRIRIQSNGLPPFCPNLDGVYIFREQNIDFAVNFNPDVSVTSPRINIMSLSDLYTAVCNFRNIATAPDNSQLVLYSSPTTVNSVAGVSLDGVAIYNGDNYYNEDTFYPVTPTPLEWGDQCLGHTDPNGTYHYHIGSSCPLRPPVGLTTSCENIPTCRESLANYSASMFTRGYHKLTPIGVSKDGHVVYGPYTSDGGRVTSGFDICNGMFFDSIGNYGYFATNTFPYIIGCFGPSNYPDKLVPNCTTNPPSYYTKSYHARLLSINNNAASIWKLSTALCSLSIIIVYIEIIY
jgi:hypothetical protein